MDTRPLRCSFLSISAFTILFLNACWVFASVDLHCQEYQLPNGTDIQIECTLHKITSTIKFDKIPANRTTIMTLKCLDGKAISHILSDTFKRFDRLRILVIKACKFVTLPKEAFKGMKSLVELHMLLQNSFKEKFHLPPKLSDDLRNLTCLSLEGIGLKTIKGSFWSNLPKLQNLSLNVNQLKKLDWLSALANTSVDISSLDLSRNLLTILPPQAFYFLPSLLTLHLDYNVFECVHENSFMNLPVLSTLTLNRVGLNDLPPCLFRNLSKLINLEISGNNISNLPDGIFNNLDSLQALNLNKNNIKFSDPTQRPFLDLVELQTINLAENDVSDIPEGIFQGLQRITELDLSFNNLINVSVKGFTPIANFVEDLDISNCNLIFLHLLSQFSTLKNISLANNKIQIIQPENLKKSKDSLRYINLQNTSLRSVTKTGEWGKNAIFASFSALSRLDLEGNIIERFDYFMVPDSLTHLGMSSNLINVIEDAFALRSKKKITNLYLDQNIFQEFNSHSFTHSLEKLSCNYCSISVIRSGAFGELSRLVNISFVNTAIRNLERFAFSVNVGMPTVTPSIKFKNNLCSTTQTPIISNIQFIHFKEGSFQHICQMTARCEASNSRKHGNVNASHFSREAQREMKIAHTEFTTIDCGSNNLSSFKCPVAKPSAVNILYLDGNILSTLKNGMFHAYTALQVLYLNNSRVKSVEEKAFFMLYNLEEMYLDDNDIKKLHSNTFYNLKKLAILSLKNNGISDISDKIFHDLTLLHTLCLDNNNLGQLYGFEFDTLTGLHILNLPNNNIKEILPNTFNGLRSLRVLHLEHNKLTKFTLSGAIQQVKLFLNDNKFRSIDTRTFRVSIKLEELHLERNEISDPFSIMGHQNSLIKLHLEENKLKSLNSSCFQGMVSLEELRLNHNDLTEIRGEIFKDAPLLATLFLHNNRLTEIHADSFGITKHLSSLSLHNNQLTDLPVWKLPASLQTVSLRGNNLTCNCNYLIPFRNWAIGTEGSNKINDINNVICKYVNGAKAVLPILQHTQRYCEAHISAQIILLISGGCFVTITVLSVLMYMHRMEMQVWLYSRYGFRFFHQDNRADIGKAYHAFVSYSSEDEEFVAELVQVLEPEFKLCIHERDFPVGAYIIDTVCEVVETSCRTLLVLSNNFIKSKWCQYEFKIAHHQTIQDHCCRLIVILMDDIDVNDADRELKVYLKTNTYLKWGDRFFWEKLKFAMPDIRGLNEDEERQPLLHQQLEND